jgi:hypothetical protein
MFHPISEPMIARKIWHASVWGESSGGEKEAKNFPHRIFRGNARRARIRRILDALAFCLFYLLLSLLYPALLTLLFSGGFTFGLSLVFGFFCLLVSPVIGVFWYFAASPGVRLSIGWTIGISFACILMPWLPLVVLFPPSLVVIIPMGGPALPVALIAIWAYARFVPWRKVVVK